MKLLLTLAPKGTSGGHELRLGLDSSTILEWEEFYNDEGELRTRIRTTHCVYIVRESWDTITDALRDR